MQGNYINKNREAFTSWRKERTLFKSIPWLVHAAGSTVLQKVNSSGGTHGRTQLQTPGTKVSEKDPMKHAGLSF